MLRLYVHFIIYLYSLSFGGFVLASICSYLAPALASASSVCIVDFMPLTCGELTGSVRWCREQGRFAFAANPGGGIHMKPYRVTVYFVDAPCVKHIVCYIPNVKACGETSMEACPDLPGASQSNRGPRLLSAHLRLALTSPRRNTHQDRPTLSASYFYIGFPCSTY